MTKILSEEFELPSEENKVDDMEVSQGNGENDPKDSNKDSNKDKGSESSPKKNGSDSAKRRGRSRSRSADRNDLRRNKTGSSYLDLFDIVNMTYEEYLEAYRCFLHVLPH